MLLAILIELRKYIFQSSNNILTIYACVFERGERVFRFRHYTIKKKKVEFSRERVLF